MNRLINILFPMIANHIANKKVRRKLCVDDSKKSADSSICASDTDSYNLEDLKNQYCDTHKIKDRLEDKAKTNIASVTIAITLIMGASSVLSQLNNKFPSSVFSWVSFILFVISVAYMLFAGILAFQLLTNENMVRLVSRDCSSMDITRQRIEYHNCIQDNQLRNIIRNNYIFSSYECIRNSLACLFLILILITVPVHPTNENQTTMFSSLEADSFFFSSQAVEYLKTNNVLTDVETILLDALKGISNESNLDEFGIIDEDNHLFFKLSVSNNRVEVLLIESYLQPAK